MPIPIPMYRYISNLNTEIEGRFGILWPTQWPFRYSLADSVAVSVFSVRFGILTHRKIGGGGLIFQKKIAAAASFSYKIGGGKDLATLLAAVLTWSGY